ADRAHAAGRRTPRGERKQRWHLRHRLVLHGRLDREWHGTRRRREWWQQRGAQALGDPPPDRPELRPGRQPPVRLHLQRHRADPVGAGAARDPARPGPAPVLAPWRGGRRAQRVDARTAEAEGMSDVTDQTAELAHIEPESYVGSREPAVDEPAAEVVAAP